MKVVKSVNLTHGNVWKTLLLYSLPLFGSAMVQQLYSLADLLVVGNFAENGADSVDAIGNAMVAVNILLSFALGANGGCSIIIAKYFGEENNKKLRETVNTAFISFSFLCAILMTIGFSIGRVSLIALDVHDSYFKDCLSYLNIYIASMPFVFIYNLGCGICSAMGDSKTPFVFLVISSLLNAGLDILFVYIFKWGVSGAAWATFISQGISCIPTVFVLVLKLKECPSAEKPRLFVGHLLKDLTITSIPVILQSSFVSVGNFFVNKRINSIGIDATTGFNTGFKLVCMANVGVGSMSTGFANFVSQNMAAGQYNRIKKGYFAELVYTLASNLMFISVLVSFPEFFTNIFIQKDKITPDALAYSVQFITIVASFLPVVCVKIVSDAGVRGGGGNLGFAISTFIDLILRVVLVYALTDLNWGFVGVCWAWVIGWSVSMFIAIGFYIVRLRTIKALTNKIKMC